ncbi:MAG: ATP-binding protein [Candidatus Ozemobacteraceae bacterium]
MINATMATKPKLPIGIQSFAKLRSGGFAYVDKTPFIARMASEAGAFFLSRPRRFGKSLLVDTLDCAFSGKRELFEGLYLDRPESGWDWTKTHPVIRIDFAEGSPDNPTEFKARLHSLIDRWTEQWGVRTTKGSPGMRLADLVRAIHAVTGKHVVVLADEYDKPILDSLSNLADAIETREILRDFYGVLKPLDEHLRFVLLTGVSKFSKAGIFSGLNNLRDITLSDSFSAICGYTETDLDTVFAQHCDGLDRDMIRRWYNGYSWGGEGVYNPFDILLLFEERRFHPWWFETGTPTFLVKLLREQPRTLPDLDSLWIGSELSDSVEPDSMRFEAVLFQTGYLTIKERTNDAIRGERYRLGFPNLEVRSAFSRLFVETFSGTAAVVSNQRELLWTALEHGDAEALRNVFHAFFAGIPHDWYRNNPIRQYEGFYCSVVYGYFASLGLDVIPEDTTNKGRVDLTVKAPWGIWLFEFKVQGLDRSLASDRDPLEQLKSRGYAEKYKIGGPGNPAGVPVRLVGVVFDPETRNLDAWSVEEL